ncbi:hypothetical protein CASFOL_039778 [Castilleja foliolosa]|uniref:RING-type E3 ubiquitin transferase n=1 Tax=Castilleja foliolosa TaxID=1961234 RepID=A0ABD3BG58_9LAMI
MDEADASRYWCHMCSQTVNPIVELDTIKCPICQSGFVEEISSTSSPTPGNDDNTPLDFELGPSDSDRALSLWAPILLGMMGTSRRHHRMRRIEFDDENENNNVENEFNSELESIMRRRRRNSATILRLLQDIRSGIQSEPNSDDGAQNRDNERVILINPFNQTIIVQGAYDPNSNNNDGLQARMPIGSLGDYFIGPGLDLLLQHLSENDPSRYGTPPARKEAVEALLNVKIEETVQCSVCLDECEVGVEVKEMPCKHKFHGECILPWLELHSSCPVCRYQLPCDESKLESEGSRRNEEGGNNSNNNINDNGGEDEGNGSGRQLSVSIPWPFGGLFSSSSGSRSGGGSSNRNGNQSGMSSREDDED